MRCDEGDMQIGWLLRLHVQVNNVRASLPLHSNKTQVRESLIKKIEINESQADYERKLSQKDTNSTNYLNYSGARRCPSDKSR